VHSKCSRYVELDAKVVRIMHEFLVRVLRVAPVYLMVGEDICDLWTGEPMSPVRRVLIMYP